MWCSTLGCLVTLTLSLLVPSLAAEAQPLTNVHRIGWLGAGSPLSSRAYVEVFQQSLRDLGYIEGQSIALEYRFAEGKFERLPELAAELVHLTMDVLVTSGSPATQAAQHVTSTIPIVGVALADPLGTGLAASFARPGGNITGLAFQNADLSTKRLELLTEAVPGVTRVAVLWDSHFPASPSAVRAVEEAARALGVQIHLLEVQGPEDFARVVAAATRERTQALLQVGSPLFATQRETFIDLVAKSRLPATCETRPCSGAFVLKEITMRLSTVGLVATLALVLLLVPLASDAQQAPKVHRIGWLRPGSPPSGSDPAVEDFQQGLRDLGYVEGQNLRIEYRYAEGSAERLHDLAAELVRLPVEVIVTGGSAPTRAAQHATRTIPIVMNSGEPVGLGFVASLTRPGGNITGMSNFSADLPGKQLELLKEVVPQSARRIGIPKPFLHRCLGSVLPLLGG